MRRVAFCISTLTYAKQNEILQHVLGSWMDFAKAGDYARLFVDMAEKSYSEKYLAKNRKWYPFLTRFGKPKDYSRFLTMADACLTHDAYSELGKIQCRTLVIGGKEDRIVTAKASEEMAEQIPDCQLFLYEGLGHGAYEEAKDFQQRIKEFLG